MVTERDNIPETPSHPNSLFIPISFPSQLLGDAFASFSLQTHPHLHFPSISASFNSQLLIHPGHFSIRNEINSRAPAPNVNSFINN